MSQISFEGVFSQGQRKDLNSSGSILAGSPTLQFEVDEDLRWTQAPLKQQSLQRSSSLSYACSRGSFAALAGMSPSLGVPPVDTFFFMDNLTPPPSSTPIFAQAPTLTDLPNRRRRRRLTRQSSVEEFPDLDESSNSNDSGIFPRNSNLILEEAPEVMGKLPDLKSFMTDMSYGEDALEMEFESSIKDEHIKGFESKLLKVIEDARNINKFGLELPNGLLGLIAGHIVQEASGEPYGLKGCILHIHYENENALFKLGTLVCDSNTISTFALTLTLRQAQASWGQRMARRLSFSSSISDYPVSTSYKLVKKCSYRQGEVEVVS